MKPAGRVRCNMRTLIGAAGSSGQLTGDGLEVTKAERLLTQRASGALHRFRDFFDRRLASRVRPQLSHVCR
jgi:hypothetical protein